MTIQDPFFYPKILAAGVMLFVMYIQYIDNSEVTRRRVVSGSAFITGVYLAVAIFSPEPWYYFWAFIWLLNTLKSAFPNNN